MLFRSLVLLSNAWRQSSARRPELDAVDADNLLVGRMPVRRLDAEALRDRVLAATGTLDLTAFGPPVPVVADDTGEFVVKEGTPRRSLWLEQRRSRPVQFLAAFDAPVMQTNCDRRLSSTAAGQSLLLMNGDFVLGAAARLSDRCLAEAGTPPADPAAGPGSEAASLAAAVDRAWHRAYLRPPDDAERAAAAAFLADEIALLRARPGDEGAPATACGRALANLCQQLLSSNEFLHVD